MIIRSKLLRTGFLLLPWFPLSIVWMTVWILYFAPEPAAPYLRMSMTEMRNVSRAEWLAEFFPHFSLYVFFTRFAVVAFGVGLVFLVVGLCCRRSIQVQSTIPEIGRAQAPD